MCEQVQDVFREKPCRQTIIQCEKRLGNQEAATMRDQPDDKAERLRSLRAGQHRWIHFFPNHPPCKSSNHNM